MTTYHELLGTTEDFTRSDIKKRYKLLSHRLHPDKSGSVILMQLISHAYNEVLCGNGNRHCELTHINHEKILLTKKYAEKVKQELALQKRKNVELEQQVLELRKKLEHQSCENKRLTETLEKKQRKKIVSTVLPYENKTWEKRYRIIKYGLVISSVVLNVGLAVAAITLTKSNVVDRVIFKRENRLIEPSLVPQKVAVEELISPKPELTTHRPIELTQIVGEWTLFQPTDQPPYIAIRNQVGSYIVQRCDRHFYYYVNMTQQRTALPANLRFMYQQQNFLVYNIAYGIGSERDHWVNSQSIKINREYFSNTSFLNTNKILQQRCDNGL
ncbi:MULTISPECIES: DnaJ domain-containing protein [unclassified Photobacterium]|uniref:DnaJ domain-containing protein n=1 Tax=unclassified Photobacterium TaxID=2628852 RepID=UPI000D1596B8|nr:MULTISPECIES: DnaJ domain-containing protein [unclassified Photobacterium]PSV32946.1 molecular chaperone DnaJ [Photobacterium sp. GB-72]PSV47806.1 molecular chaperone DnaJ [Photobacterium sp. GB-36]PSW72663.1 molecular chaperone DnaJ [Photobacterium sp. GB-50]